MAASDNIQPLGEAIAASTRGIHARLNKSIISRLPLALPPRASDPSTYVTGLIHIAPIYLAFESLWNDFLEPGPEDGVDPHAELVAPLLSVAETPTGGRWARLADEGAEKKLAAALTDGCGGDLQRVVPVF
ncbi:hypothetical protein NLG97_g7726 [Lecanicillium saksenae]|uniref:Uncharacterized protein n=1 Tax=Lecanicillium saksenae TaxID=468837 RepID=A0ACC1QNB6_9HYPO|nr:hypothetical protein NLG97_g7726 [Lecanicillium saksenae]